MSTENNNIIDITAENCESQELLDAADVLITDYSSCYIDFLLLNRPIIFYNYDMEAYQSNDRKLYFEYNEVTPGAKCSNAKALYDELVAIFNGDDKYLTDRQRVCDLFYDKKAQKMISDALIEYVRKLK